jgi:hypothetical protein
MVKKRKIWKKYECNGKLFNTFKDLKTYAWHSMRINQIAEGYEIANDQIYKTYKINRKERRILIEKTYDLEEEMKKYYDNLQLKMFNNESNT